MFDISSTPCVFVGWIELTECSVFTRSIVFLSFAIVIVLAVLLLSADLVANDSAQKYVIINISPVT